MNLLVIGGTYFLGKTFVELVSGEHKVTLLNRGNRKVDFGNKENMIEVIGDRHNPQTYESLKGQTFDAVIDFCAYQTGDIRQVFDALGNGIKRYIYISTSDVYKKGTGVKLTEDAPLETRDFGGEAGAYILGKVALESELLACTTKANIQGTSIRPAFIYGPDNYAPRETIFFQWILGQGQILFPSDAEGFFQMVFARDVAKAIVQVCQLEQIESAYNICGNTLFDYTKYSELLKESTGIDFDKVPVTVEEILQKNIPMAFPLMVSESEECVDSGESKLGITYTDAVVGMKETFQWFQAQIAQTEAVKAEYSLDIQEIMDKIDGLFGENKAKEAEQYLLNCLIEAKKRDMDGLRLQILNELIGYYRQTSEVDKLNAVIDSSMKIAESMKEKDPVAFATTALNAANAYRAIGEREKSLNYYNMTQVIYARTLSGDDMLWAGLYNNMSLLYQELKEYQKAEEFLLAALDIVTKNKADFEIAVTYANLANTAVIAKDFKKVKEYADTAIACFEKMNLFDPHYCAALSALAMCHFEQGEYEKAEQLFAKGMEIIEKILGRNLQYERLKENRDRCVAVMNGVNGKQIDKNTMDGLSENYDTKKEDKENKKENMSEIKSNKLAGTNKNNDIEMTDKHDEVTKKEVAMKGLELSRQYYEEFGKDMIHTYFSEYEDKICVGLVGEGSDCMGFDDETSRDHDWGPDFCMWLSDETYEAIGEELKKQYNELPLEYKGYQRTKSEKGIGRRGVLRISDFYKRLVGTNVYEEIDFRTVEDYNLMASTNGAVFRDDEGVFTAIRNQIKQGYPEDIRLLKIAEDMAKVCQSGQYNYFRMFDRGDLFTADFMLKDCIVQTMKLWHHIWNVFPPHDKWLHESTKTLPGGEELLSILYELRSCMNQDDKNVVNTVRECTEKLASFITMELYKRGDISDIETYLDVHTDELVKKSQMAVLSDKELVDLIAKTEFEAFDKVKNEGGRASCQNDWPTFSIMRKSQYLTWNRTMLIQYLYDFNREFAIGHNLITEKYGRMMESTAPEKYEEIKDNFPVISEEKKAIIEQIVAVQMNMVEEFAKDYPKSVSNARTLHTYEDNPGDTSYETYLRGEISTYSDKMLQLYAQYVIGMATEHKNIARMTIENTAMLYGYKDLDEFESRMH